MVVKSPLINVMERAARKAGRGLIRDFGEVEQLQASPTGPGGFVITADLKSAALLREELARARPDFGFLTEDGGEIAGRDGAHRWIVDPLDGADNFLHGIPRFCISIAVERDFTPGRRVRSETIAGLVYNPLTDESFWADKAQGAYLNDRRMRVSGRRAMAEALFAIGWPTLDEAGRQALLAHAAALLAKAGSLRRFGSAALDLAYVAAGRFDGYWQEGLEPWNLAAGVLLVREAGGFVSELGGGSAMMETGSIVAANDHLHADLRRVLEAAEPGPA
ncbi:MAG: inositol monophosphatase family protein [Alphaproteobacteria bacterium]|nr:inositol monophosphatase family protein [Alphaproteobacteria bacterium]MCZ6609666.1 inositol monophosphatase family protein [Alphaproteobacteria bacterium]